MSKFRYNSVAFKAYAIVNAILICALYTAIFTDCRWLSVVVIAFLWVFVVVNAISFLRRKIDVAYIPAPHWLGYLVDALIFIPMLAAGWHLTALAYFIGVFLSFFVYRYSEIRAARDHEVDA